MRCISDDRHVHYVYQPRSGSPLFTRENSIWAANFHMLTRVPLVKWPLVSVQMSLKSVSRAKATIT